jgi:UDP-arabinose 4-epimerase
MDGPRILVTGGAGYIGSHVCRALAQAGFLPIALDDLSAGHAARVQWGPLVQADVTDAASLHAAMAMHQPMGVVHLAGKISVPESVADPLPTYAANTLGTLNLLGAMQTADVRAVVFSSTAAVYGTPEAVPIGEGAALKPINPYGHSKRMAEQLLADAAPALNMSSVALRYFNAAGATPEAKLGYDRARPFHLLPMALLATLGRVPPLQVFGTDYPTPDGTAVRDYIHVADLAEAHVLALQQMLGVQGAATHRALNLGTGHGASVRQVLDVCATVTGRPVPHVLAARRAGDPAELVADPAAAKMVLGWEPRQSDLRTLVASEWAWQQQLAAAS